MRTSDAEQSFSHVVDHAVPTLTGRMEPVDLLGESPPASITSLTTQNVYFIGRAVAEGAFGLVRRCTDLWENELVIKVLKPRADARIPLRDMAAREIEALLHVRHPFVVPVFDAFVIDEHCCIVSEYCGTTLAEFKSMPDFEPRHWVRGLSRCILQALHFTHVQTLAHCDIHDGNVFVHFVRDEILPEKHSAMVFKLGDYGLARPLSDVTAEGTFLNKICPPEVIDPSEFGPVDKRVDVYQAGLLLLQFMLPGMPPFRQEDILNGVPQDIALAENEPIFEAIARMVRRHVEYRTSDPMEAWEEIRAALVKS